MKQLRLRQFDCGHVTESLYDAMRITTIEFVKIFKFGGMKGGLVSDVLHVFAWARGCAQHLPAQSSISARSGGRLYGRNTSNVGSNVHSLSTTYGCASARALSSYLKSQGEERKLSTNGPEPQLPKLPKLPKSTSSKVCPVAGAGGLGLFGMAGFFGKRALLFLAGKKAIWGLFSVVSFPKFIFIPSWIWILWITGSAHPRHFSPRRIPVFRPLCNHGLPCEVGRTGGKECRTTML
jgi:hypothetical protein